MDAVTAFLLVVALGFVACGAVPWRRRSGAGRRDVDGRILREHQAGVQDAMQQHRRFP